MQIATHATLELPYLKWQMENSVGIIGNKWAVLEINGYGDLWKVSLHKDALSLLGIIVLLGQTQGF